MRISWPVPLQTGAGRLQVGRSTSLGQFSHPGDPLLALEAVVGVCQLIKVTLHRKLQATASPLCELEGALLSPKARAAPCGQGQVGA